MRTVLANATLVLPHECIRGALVLSDGVIEAIDHGGAVPPGAVDCGGDLLAPGLVELHTDNLERHIQPRPGVDWPHADAILAHDSELAGVGITTVFDALRVGSVIQGRRTDHRPYARPLASEILSLRDRGALRISHFLHLRAELCSHTLEEELAAFGPGDRVGLLSLMEHVPGRRQFRDMARYRDYLQTAFGYGPAEFTEHVALMHEVFRDNGPRHRSAAVAAARRLGARLASHDDTTEEDVASSARDGAVLAEFPTTEAAARACRRAGIAVMMGAPNLIRGGSHSGNVAAEELAQRDMLDVLSSDYVPGALLTGALALGRLWDDTARGIAAVTAHPARAAGLDDRGHLTLGARADVIRVARIGDTAAVRGTWVQGRRVA